MRFVVLILLTGAAVGVFVLNWQAGVFQGFLLGLPERPQAQETEEPISQVAPDLSVEEVGVAAEQEVFAAAPLRILDDSSGQLSSQGVWEWTNAHRREAGLAALVRDALLDSIAQTKLQDMFLRQYFEHISPTGEGVSDLAERAGYEYIALGENLALGGYASDEALVQAWMDSPGHRANILQSRFQEIGVAVGQGTFEGRTTWLAVQVFAKPLSACPAPDEAIRGEIDLKKIQIEELGIILEREREALDNTFPKWGSSYRKRVDEYNALAARYNELVGETQVLVREYNGQVYAFNACAE